MITWENYEKYMVMYADGELGTAEEQALMAFLYENPELQSELTAFTMTKMIPDATETYDRKESLLQPVEDKKVIVLPVWRRYAIAAGVALLLMVGGARLLFNENNVTERAYHSVAGNVSGSNVANPVAVTTVPDKNNLAANIPAAKNDVIPTVPPVQADNRKGVKTRPVKINTAKPNTPAIAMEAVAMVETLPVAEPMPISTEQKNIALAVTNVPALAIQYREDETVDEAKSFVDMLPLAETKKQGMKTLAGEVATGYGRVSSLTQEIAHSNVSVKISRKKLVLSF